MKFQLVKRLEPLQGLKPQDTNAKNCQRIVKTVIFAVYLHEAGGVDW